MECKHCKNWKFKNQDNWAYDFLRIESIKKKHNVDGSDVVVAIIDTGFEIEDDILKKRFAKTIDLSGCHGAELLSLLKNEGTQRVIEAIENNEFSVTPVEKDPDTEYNHGSNVASIIGGRSNNRYSGVAHGCKMLGVRLMDKYGKWEHDMVTIGVLWAIAEGANIINISWALTLCSMELHESIIAAYLKKAIIISGIGDDGERDNLPFPAAFHKTLAIGGCTRKLSYVDRGNDSRMVDFLAPGEGIKSPFQFESMSGSSFATGFLSGIVALYFERSLKVKGRYPSYQEVKTSLIKSCIPLPPRSDSTKWGYGIICAKKFMSTI